ncbi:MAG: AI-2E family transporter [Chloroflexi bacterium]|nr:AI-2E family transporter [Chloroflexota bacterium]
MNETPSSSSPNWGATTKLVIALTIVAIAAGLFIQFHSIIGPLFIAFILAYLLHPIASFLQRSLHIAWQLTVGLIYLLLFVFLLGLLTLGGVGLIQQIQSLVSVVQNNLTALPEIIESLSGRIYQFGPFQLDFRTLDLNALSTQLLGIVNPLLGRTGTLLSTVASGAAQFLGWALFVLLISYFVLAESGGLRGRIVWLDIPGYAEDIQRLGHELGHIWNAFLRGQIIIFFLTAVAYTIVLSILGIRYAIGIAFLAGLAKFVPYVGPFITWTTLALVTYFQPAQPLGLTPLSYTIIAVTLALLIDQIFDNIITPRIISQTLRVHPAGVLVAALIAASLLGLLGVVVAAPMLATVALLWRYTMRKMLDLDPWPEPQTQPLPPPGSRLIVHIRRFWRGLRGRRVK